MILHVLNNLLDVRLHALDFLVLIWVERLLRLYIILFLVFSLFMSRLGHGESAHVRILLCLVANDLESVRSITEFVETGRSIIPLEVVIDVDEGEVRHTRTVQDLGVDKAPRLRECRFSKQPNELVKF